MININVAKELVKMYDNLTLEDFERENVYCVKRLRH